MKTITYDSSSLQSMMHALNRLKSDIGNLKSKDCGSRNQREDSILVACRAILATDISVLYGFDCAADRKEHYVYAHCDSTKPVFGSRLGRARFASELGLEFWPFYIGKGVGNRFESLERNETHKKVRQMLSSVGKEVHVVKLAERLTERQALALESKLIDIFGLRTVGGLLVNLDEGAAPSKRRALYANHLAVVSPFYKQLFEPNSKLEARRVKAQAQ